MVEQHKNYGKSKNKMVIMKCVEGHNNMFVGKTIFSFLYIDNLDPNCAKWNTKGYQRTKLYILITKLCST